MRIVERAQVYAQNAASARQVANLYEDLGIQNSIILGITLTLRGNQVSTAGGAISGFHRDAPAGMITNFKFSGGYGPWRNKTRIIANAPPQQMFYPGNLEAGAFQVLLRTSAGASSTDPIRAVIPLPLVDSHSRWSEMTWIDVRDYVSLNAEWQWAADADLATTNVSDVTALELEIRVKVLEDGPPMGTPHFEPSVSYKELTAASASTKLTDNGQLVWDGWATAIWQQQHDDSAAGDSERVDGLTRRVTIQQAGVPILNDVTWDGLKRDTFAKYPYGLSTTEVVGVAGTPFDPPLDIAVGPAQHTRDTSSANPPGITAVTPAASDALFTLIISAEPVHGAEAVA